MVDTKLRRLEAMKQKGDKLLGVGWQDLPLELRRQINEIFPMVEKAKEMGWWIVGEEEQKILMDEYRRAEDAGVLL